MPGDMPTEINMGFFPGRRFSVEGIPAKLRGTRVRWTLHPEKSQAGPCAECKALSGQFMSIEEGTGLLPQHVNCVCSLKMEPAPGVGSSASPKWYSLQERNPELWKRAVDHKRAAFDGGHSN